MDLNDEIEYILAQQKALDYSVTSQDGMKLSIRFQGEEMRLEVTQAGFYNLELRQQFDTFEALMMSSFPSFQEVFFSKIMRQLSAPQ